MARADYSAFDALLLQRLEALLEDQELWGFCSSLPNTDISRCSMVRTTVEGVRDHADTMGWPSGNECTYGNHDSRSIRDSQERN